MNIRLLFLISLAVVLGGGACYMWLFRTVTEDNPSLGIIYYKFHWGAPQTLLADTDRDGRIDFKATYENKDDFSGASSEYWEDGDFDGHFELHVFQDHGKVDRIEVDSNNDGIYDTVYEGDAAKSFYEESASRRRGGSGIQVQ